MSETKYTQKWKMGTEEMWYGKKKNYAPFKNAWKDSR